MLSGSVKRVSLLLFRLSKWKFLEEEGLFYVPVGCKKERKTPYLPKLLKMNLNISTNPSQMLLGKP